MQTMSLMNAMFAAFGRPGYPTPSMPFVLDWRSHLFARGPRRRRAWTPARRHAETAACARRRRQIADGRLKAANGLVSAAAALAA